MCAGTVASAEEITFARDGSRKIQMHQVNEETETMTNGNKDHEEITFLVLQAGQWDRSRSAQKKKINCTETSYDGLKVVATMW